MITTSNADAANISRIAQVRRRSIHCADKGVAVFGSMLENAELTLRFRGNVCRKQR